MKDARTGRYILANRAAEALFGHADGLSGLRAGDVLPAPFAAWEQAEDANPAHPNSAVHHDVTPQRERYLFAVKVATYDDDGVRHVIGLTEDVTQKHRDAIALRQALEAAEQASQAKSAFLTNISHEIRTPLNGVVAGIDLLSANASDPRTAELLEMVRTSAGALARRLEEMMTVSRLGAGAGPANREPFDPVDVLRGLAARFAEQAAAKALAVRLEASPDLTAVLGDAECLADALARLIDNAIKFTERGEVVLDARRLDDGRVRFSVADTGVGFDPTLKARMFDSFHQGDETLTRRFGGLGLGLTIAREMARLMGGELDAAVRDEGGACFWIDVPLPCAPPPASTPEAGPDEPRRLRVLVADDHPTNRRIVELMLADMAEITEAEDGLAAVEAAQDGVFDLVLMDIQMPRMDGITAVARIRDQERLTGRPRTPIVMLTANTQAEHLSASRAAGADRHIGKPFTATSLMREIQAVVAEACATPASA